MIFEEFVLENFGIYKGRHLINLLPASSKKVIILFGGLNGSGKTTLLEALQLVLYGKFAKTGVNYLDYLAKMINRNVDPVDGANLELQFRHFREGKEEAIRIRRSWSLNGKNIKESVEVQRDGVLDPVITERWYEYVEEFIPAQIASLFFFDGEKIEAFANQDKAALLLRIGIQALLGLDLVDRLDTDLLTIERKRKSQLQSQETIDEIIELEKELKQLTIENKNIKQEKKEIKLSLKDLKITQDKLKKEYRFEGGELFEQRQLIENDLKNSKQQLLQNNNELREIAIGDVPLLLVSDLLNKVDKQVSLEQDVEQIGFLNQVVNKRDDAILKLLIQQEVADSALSAFKKFIIRDKTERQKKLKTECYLNLNSSALVRLEGLGDIKKSTKKFIKQAQILTNKIEAYERKLDSIPDPSSLDGINEKLKNIKADIEQNEFKLEQLIQESERLQNDIGRKKNVLDQTYEDNAREQFINETKRRILKHSETVRNTLEKFRIAMLEKHINKLESLILDSFQNLIRKENFISRIEINPIDYSFNLYTGNNEYLATENLSAGERQLLAVSILWGLSRASGRPLPAIIDTPLSRLDGQHRQNLVENYFPQASHQVILLSTDEEINKKYYRELKPAIGRTYHICYDEELQSSVFKKDYLF
jgi:DNA sulfur modification protein DndD